jgi:hypothetical protein
VTQLPPPPDRPDDAFDVGHFEQGTPGSRWALGRYLVGRAIGEYISRALWVFALLVIAVGALVWWLGPNWLAVLIWVLALGVLLLRWEHRMRRLVADTRGDVWVELRRLGVPSRAWTLPLLALRLARPSWRAETLRRLRGFDVERVVPAARLDELHLMVQQATRRGST